MAWSFLSRLAGLLVFAHVFSPSLGQSPGTNTPVPPLQWIEITDLLSGPAPPGLKYASIGFDTSSRTLIIFGGESNGFPLQNTYLLNVTSLTWFTPVPPDGLSTKPPARSAAISGADFAASNRHGHLVIGGKGASGQPLDDAWEFNYVNQFWSQVNISAGGPSARYSASGGTDLTAAAIPDGNVPGPNNTFYLAGGYDGENIQPLSDVWEFEVAGVQSPNIPDGVLGSWTKISFPSDLPSRVRQAGTVMPSARLVAAGGCGTADFSDDSCAQQDAHVLNIDATNDISPSGCPAPRVGPVLVPNYNTFSNSFSSQAFMLLGMFNNSLWDDNNGLNMGEVDVFSTDSGVWTRVLPAGDPGSSESAPKFPAPREGAVAISSPHSLVGANPSVGADILVFGGQDANGNYLNDMWLLRSYQAVVTSTNESWSGFGNGVLETGVDASGTGVKIQYMTSCATAIKPSGSGSSGSSPSSTSPPSSSSTSPPKNPDISSVFPFDTSVSHKVLSPASIAIILAALSLYRFSLPSVNGADEAHIGFASLAGAIGLIGYAVGVVGIIVSFTSISSSSNSNLKKRSNSSLILKTSHGKVGLAFFVLLYALLPLLFGSLLFSRRRRTKVSQDLPVGEPDQPEVVRKNSNETNFTALTTPGREKRSSGGRGTMTPTPESPDPIPDSPVSEARSRSRSLLGPHLWPGYRAKEKATRPSSESGRESTNSVPVSRSFEVLNRGNRSRRLSSNGLNGLGGYGSDGGHSTMPRSLSDLSWLDRRRSVAAIGDLDYALTQLNHTGGLGSTPATDTRSMRPLISTPHPEERQPLIPTPMQCLSHILLHTFILGISVLTLVVLWERAPKATFVIFLLWTLAFYAILFFLASHGIPRVSILTVIISSLKDHHRQPGPPLPPSPSSRPLSTLGNEQYAFPTSGDSRSPYAYHQPLYRRAFPTAEDEILSSNEHGTQADDDEDEDEQQRRIEQEMERRDVSIVTVPRRKLWITNPS